MVNLFIYLIYLFIQQKKSKGKKYPKKIVLPTSIENTLISKTEDEINDAYLWLEKEKKRKKSQLKFKKNRIEKARGFDENLYLDEPKNTELTEFQLLHAKFKQKKLDKENLPHEKSSGQEDDVINESSAKAHLISKKRLESFSERFQTKDKFNKSKQKLASGKKDIKTSVDGEICKTEKDKIEVDESHSNKKREPRKCYKTEDEKHKHLKKTKNTENSRVHSNRLNSKRKGKKEISTCQLLFFKQKFEKCFLIL